MILAISIITLACAFFALVRYVERKDLKDSTVWLWGVGEIKWRTPWEIRNWYLYTHGDWDGTLFGLSIFHPWKGVVELDRENHRKITVKWYSYFFSPLIYEDLRELEKKTLIKKRYVHPHSKLVRFLFRLPPAWAKPYLEWTKPLLLRREYRLSKEGVAYFYHIYRKSRSRTTITLDTSSYLLD